MDGFKITEQEEEEKPQQLLNLSLSLVSRSYGTKGDQNTMRKKTSNHESSTSRGPGDDVDDHHHHEGEILELLQHREQMLRLHNTRLSVLEDVDHEERIKKDPPLINLILKIATSIDEYNLSSAVADLIKIYQYVSLGGDSLQRVAAYLADGLTARLVKEKPQLYDLIMKDPTSAEEFLGFTHLYRVSPCYQFSHFTANQAILEAFDKEQGGRKHGELHVVDFDLAYGFQWPSLIHSLSDKATTTNTIISLRITGFARSLEELVETEARLISFSEGFGNMFFGFQVLLRGTQPIHTLVQRRESETLAVNLVSCLHSLRKNTPNTSDTIRSIRRLNPSILVMVRRGGNHDPNNLISYPTKLINSLHYYKAILDSLDDCLPRDSLERICIERNHLGKEMKSTAANCFRDEVKIFEKYGRWQKRLEDHGFIGMKLSTRTTMEAKLLMRMRSHHHLAGPVEGELSGGFRVSESENGKALSLCWQDRVLITASAWQSAV